MTDPTVDELVAVVHGELLDDDPIDRSARVRLTADLAARRAPLLSSEGRADIVDRVMARVEGLGVLEGFLADSAVTELMINGPGPVVIERDGRLIRTDVVLTRPEIDRLIERVVAPLGRRVDRRSPWVDGRLADGSRVNVVVPPVALDGPYLTIRRFRATKIALAEVAEPEPAELLRLLVARGANVVVSGGTGAGKTTLLNVLAGLAERSERIITVEDAAELQLDHHHVVRLETRPQSSEGVGLVTVRDLVRNALRMRPDRLVVGEVRGDEALDMIQALNTGHAGCLSTVHANSPGDAIRRIESLALQAGHGLPFEALRPQVAAAIDAIVQVERTTGAGRRVVEISEVRGPDCMVKVADQFRVVEGLQRPARYHREPA